MIQFASMNKSLKSSWVKRFKDDRDAPWKVIPNYLVSHSGVVNFLLGCNYKFKDLVLDDLPLFSCNLLSCWEEIKRIAATKKNINLKVEIIWNNTDVKVNGKTVFFKKWYDKGVMNISHLPDERNNFLSLDKFTEKFNLKIHFTTYFGLIHAIKEKKGISQLSDPTNSQSQSQTQNWYEDDKNLRNASLLKLIVESQFSPPTTQSQILRQGISDIDLPKLYKCPFNSTHEVKLVMFQFKIIHNIIYTKDKLKKANLALRDICYLCKLETHTLQHMLANCPHVQHFWDEFCSWWQISTNEHLNLSSLTIIYGFINNCKLQHVLNYCMLIAKYFIYKCFLSD